MVGYQSSHPYGAATATRKQGKGNSISLLSVNLAIGYHHDRSPVCNRHNAA